MTQAPPSDKLSAIEVNELREFGYHFLGPMCSEYFFGFKDLTPGSPLFFLAREGYFLRKIYLQLLEQKLLPAHPNQYLICSRASLFKFNMGNPETWELALSSTFQGSLAELLEGRFAMAPDKISDIFSQKELKETLQLPLQKDKTIKIFRSKQENLQKTVEPSLKAYLQHLRDVGFMDNSSPPILLDIGYSGTMQKLLSLITNLPTEGYYFIASQSGDQQINDVPLKMKGAILENVRFGEGHPLLENSLNLECLMTSPEGQMKDCRRIKASDGLLRPGFGFGPKSRAQESFFMIEAVMEGTLEHVEHAFIHNIRYSTDDIVEMYELHLSNLHLFPSNLMPLFELDDAISGRGTRARNRLA